MSINLQTKESSWVGLAVSCSLVIISYSSPWYSETECSIALWI